MGRKKESAGVGVGNGQEGDGGKGAKYFIYMYGNVMMRPINIHNNKFITENHRVLDSEGLEWCLRPCLHPAQVTMAPLPEA